VVGRAEWANGGTARYFHLHPPLENRLLYGAVEITVSARTRPPRAAPDLVPARFVPHKAMRGLFALSGPRIGPDQPKSSRLPTPTDTLACVSMRSDPLGYFHKHWGIPYAFQVIRTPGVDVTPRVRRARRLGVKQIEPPQDSSDRAFLFEVMQGQIDSFPAGKAREVFGREGPPLAETRYLLKYVVFNALHSNRPHLL
jgi:hypothetical protein